MLLEDKVAVVYGARGAIGGAAAQAFADEGARVFGADVDALDEQAVAEHLQQVVDEAGRVDVSFNAIGLPDTEIVGEPLESTDAQRFARPIAPCRRVSARSSTAATARPSPPRRRSPATSPPSSRPTASAWSACGPTACPSPTRCARSSRPSTRA
jgi:NAD(P)-dependent dehydrogenase (short-subunit alcohol dehydrogenase family)